MCKQAPTFRSNQSSKEIRKMNEQLQEKLKGLGLTDEHIAALIGDGVTEESDMPFVTPEDLIAHNVPKVTARKVVAAFAPNAPVAVSETVPAVAAPAANGPIHVTVDTGDLNDKRLSELLTLIASGDKDPELRRIVKQKSGGHVCFVRNDDGKLDVEATLECYEFIVDTGEAVDMWRNRVVETLDEVLERERRADPLDGTPLQGWIAPDGVDWSNVPESNQVLAAFARLQGLLDSGYDRHVLVKELESANPDGRWTRVAAKYAAAEKKYPEQVAAARASLRYRSNQPSSKPSKVIKESVAEADRPSWEFGVKAVRW